MKVKSILNLPQKSIFGFKVLSSFNSSVACYILLIIDKSLNPLFGLTDLQIITGSLFNIVLNLSFVILIINLTFKRKQLKILYFILLNLILFIYFPFALDNIVKFAKILFNL